MPITLTAICISAAMLIESSIPVSQNEILNDFRDSDGSWGELAAEAAPEVAQFGQLVGLWQIETRSMDRQGQWSDGAGAYWAWKYILGGHAVQDLYLQIDAAGKDTRITQLRIYDPKTNNWNISWINTIEARHGNFIAHSEDGTLIMTDPNSTAGYPVQIVFSDISDDRWVWEYQIMRSDSDQWLAVSIFTATRLE